MKIKRYVREYANDTIRSFQEDDSLSESNVDTIIHNIEEAISMLERGYITIHECMRIIGDVHSNYAIYSIN